jgi:hypothetical protein
LLTPVLIITGAFSTCSTITTTAEQQRHELFLKVG